MSHNQIEYIDHLLPSFGCRGVEDADSLFNKSTISDWESLRNKINTEMPTIKNIFPTKSLNLGRMNSVITTDQQALALLRGLYK